MSDPLCLSTLSTPLTSGPVFVNNKYNIYLCHAQYNSVRDRRDVLTHGVEKAINYERKVH